MMSPARHDAHFRRLSAPRRLWLLLALFPMLFVPPPAARAPAHLPYEPSEDLGPLFADVQLGGVFEDSKTFVDARPLRAPAALAAQYARQKGQPGFDLEAFVEAHFALPPEIACRRAPTPPRYRWKSTWCASGRV